MARPGKINELRQHISCKGNFPEEHLAVMAVAGTLLDSEVTFAPLGDKMKELAPHISLMTESRVAEPEEADFLLSDGLYPATGISCAKRGSLLFPEGGATIILEVEELLADGMDVDTYVVVEGPGVPEKRGFAICGLFPENLALVQEANEEFPLGVDVILVSRSNRVTCLPRSVRFESLSASYGRCRA
jgi:alpha-D-ribose 1-methylphosphonate 5-triphosphate synthase subunit PhnH